MIATNILLNKNVLVTGGTGSFGRKFIDHILKKQNPSKVIVLVEMSKNISKCLKSILKINIKMLDIL